MSPLIGAGAEFRNLGFEEADLNLETPGQELGAQPITKALPGWKLYFGTNLYDIYVNPVFLPGAFGALFDKHAIVAPVRPAEGKWILFLSRQTNEPMWKLEQSGTVPSTAKFFGYLTVFDEMELQINGEIVPPIKRLSRHGFIGSTDVLTNLVFDLSRFSGENVTLSLIGPNPPDSFSFSWAPWIPLVFIDSLRFASAPPRLTVRRSGGQLLVIWPAETLGYVLQFRDALSPAAPWENVSEPPAVDADEMVVTVHLDNSDSGRLFRLAF